MTYLEVGIAIEMSHWGSLGRVPDIPMVNCNICHESEGILTYPRPEVYVFTHRAALQLRLRFKVKDLEGSALRLECNDLLVPVHNRAVSLDRSPDDIVAFFEFDDEDFRLCLLAELLTNTDERIRL